MECVRILGLNSSCANALEFMQKDRDFKPVFSDFPWVVVHIFYGILWAHSDYLFCSSCRTGAPGRHVYIHELWPYLHFNHICLDQRWPFDPKRVNRIISCGRLLLFLIHYPFCIYVLCLMTLQFFPLEVECFSSPYQCWTQVCDLPMKCHGTGIEHRL